MFIYIKYFKHNQSWSILLEQQSFDLPERIVVIEIKRGGVALDLAVLLFGADQHWMPPEVGHHLKEPQGRVEFLRSPEHVADIVPFLQHHAIHIRLFDLRIGLYQVKDFRPFLSPHITYSIKSTFPLLMFKIWQCHSITWSRKSNILPVIAGTRTQEQSNKRGFEKKSHSLGFLCIMWLSHFNNF